jgi:hypothetical protein
MDFHTAVKLQQQQQANFGTMPMLTPLPTYTPQIVDGFSYSSSPETSMAAFSQHMDKNSLLTAGRMTPRTPEPFVYNEPLQIVDPFDQYTNTQAWSDDGLMPIGLGFESDIPGLLPDEGDMRVWTPEFDGNSTPVANMNAYDPSMCDSPASVWATPSVSVSPPQLPHTRAVPSLSISECSAPDSDSPRGIQEEWSNFRAIGKPVTSGAYFDNIKSIPKNQALWGAATF